MRVRATLTLADLPAGAEVDVDPDDPLWAARLRHRSVEPVDPPSPPDPPLTAGLAVPGVPPRLSGWDLPQPRRVVDVPSSAFDE